MRLIFRRGASDALRRLQHPNWRCASCGADHEGLFHLSVLCPSVWQGAEEYEPNEALRLDGDFLSEDFCVIRGEHFFVRAVFEIPVHGLAECFGFGIWSTLSRRNFDNYLSGFDDGAYADPGPWPGYFSNQLDPFGATLNQPCWVHVRSDRQRPLITLADRVHPLALAQANGITAERVLEIYADYGHEAE